METDNQGRLQSIVGAGGSPAFTLLLIESNSRAILRAAEEGLAAVVQKRASRLPQLAVQLRRRSKKSASHACLRATNESSAITDCISRIRFAANVADAVVLQHEIGLPLQLVASYSHPLKEDCVDDQASSCLLD